MRARFNPTVAAFAACALGLAAFAADTFYTVHKGDTLSGIASRHGLTTKELAAANALKDADELSVGQHLRIPMESSSLSPAATAGNAEKYTVRSGDTLSEIASRHGTTAEKLVNANGIRDPKELRIGQVLLIPGWAKPQAAAAVAPTSVASTPASAAPTATPSALPLSMRKLLDAQKVVAGKWRYIVVHHSATSVGSARSMDLYHRNIRHMENGLAYHFVIGNGRGETDGSITVGSRWRRQIKGGHLASERLNEKSIGICLVGNFEANRPTKRQLASLYALVNYLEDRCRTPADAVKTHRQINTKPTSCPGRLFPTQSLLANT